jgi:uncharacterized protein (DUF2236 family)
MTGTVLNFNTYSPDETGRAELAAEPAGQAKITPDSLLFQLVGDQRYGLAGLAAGQLQLMHPAIGAGVIEHSDFFDDPWDRVFRSVPLIIGSVCDPDHEAIAERVRKRHNKIGGDDDGHGNHYHALDPETFWAAHATFTDTAFRVADRLTNLNLDSTQRQQLYAESVQWYASYGLDMSPVPKNYKSFLEKWHYLCDEVFERTPAANEAINIARDRRIPKPPNITDKLWQRRIIKMSIAELVSLSALGGIPAEVRERLEVPFSRIDQSKFRGVELALKQGFRFLPKWLLPDSARYFPQAIKGMEAARQGQMAA